MIKQKVGTQGEGLGSVKKTSKIRVEKLFEQVKKCASNYPNIYKIVLFGSRARGDYRPNSDIDLAIFSSSSSNLEVANFTNEIADEICDRIIETYFQEFKALSKRLAE